MSLWAGPETAQHKNLPHKDFKKTFGLNDAVFLHIYCGVPSIQVSWYSLQNVTGMKMSKYFRI